MVPFVSICTKSIKLWGTIKAEINNLSVNVTPQSCRGDHTLFKYTGVYMLDVNINWDMQQVMIYPPKRIDINFCIPFFWTDLTGVTRDEDLGLKSRMSGLGCYKSDISLSFKTWVPQSTQKYVNWLPSKLATTLIYSKFIIRNVFYDTWQ